MSDITKRGTFECVFKGIEEWPAQMKLQAALANLHLWQKDLALLRTVDGKKITEVKLRPADMASGLCEAALKIGWSINARGNHYVFIWKKETPPQLPTVSLEKFYELSSIINETSFEISHLIMKININGGETPEDWDNKILKSFYS